MSRFFFDFCQGLEHCRDPEGTELPSAEDAFLEAVRAAQEMWSGLLAERRDPRACVFRVRDSEENLLFVIPFSELLESCHDSRSRAPVPHGAARQALENWNRTTQLKQDLRHEFRAARAALQETRGLLAAI